MSTKKETGSGGGEGHSEERQPPLVRDVSTATKNSPGEKQQRVEGYWWGWLVIGGESKHGGQKSGSMWRLQ